MLQTNSWNGMTKEFSALRLRRILRRCSKKFVTTTEFKDQVSKNQQGRNTNWRLDLLNMPAKEPRNDRPKSWQRKLSMTRAKLSNSSFTNSNRLKLLVITCKRSFFCCLKRQRLMKSLICFAVSPRVLIPNCWLQSLDLDVGITTGSMMIAV